MNRFQKLIVLLLVGVVFTSCKSNSKLVSNENILPSAITVKGDQFVDNYGRQVILNGINIGSKNKKDGYNYQSDNELYSNLKKWYVN